MSVRSRISKLEGDSPRCDPSRIVRKIVRNASNPPYVPEPAGECQTCGKPGCGVKLVITRKVVTVGGPGR